MRNTLGDLNNYLFMAMERLNDEDLKGELFEIELQRSKAMCDVASNIVNNAKVILQAHLNRPVNESMPKMLGGGALGKIDD